MAAVVSLPQAEPTPLRGARAFEVQRAIVASSLTATEKAVVLVLLIHADEHLRCHPSQARIAWETSLEPRTVQRTMASLRLRGVVRVLRAGNWARSHRYLLRPEALPLRAPWRGRSSIGEVTIDDRPITTGITTDKPPPIPLADAGEPEPDDTPEGGDSTEGGPEPEAQASSAVYSGQSIEPEVERVEEAWSATGLPALDARGRAAIGGRRREGAALAELLLAVAGASADPWLRRPQCRVPHAVVFASLASVGRFADAGRELPIAPETPPIRRAAAPPRRPQALLDPVEPADSSFVLATLGGWLASQG